MKKSAQNRIIIWSTVSAALIIVLIAGFVVNAGGRYVPSINQRMYGEYYDVDTETAYNQADGLGYSDDELLHINIYLSNGKVIFKESNSDYIEITQLNKATGDETGNFYYRYFEDDRSLEIFGSDEDFRLEDQDYSSNSFMSGLDNIFSTSPSKTFVVEIPKRGAYLPYITVNCASADIEIDDINTDNISINSFSGSITANNLKTEYISIENVSGDVNLSNTEANEVFVNSVSGNINIDGKAEYVTLNSVSGDLDYSTYSLSTNSISINTVSGDTTITLPKNSGFNVYNSSVSGNIESGFKGNYIDDNYVYGDGSIEIELNSVSGSINIQPANENRSEQAKAEQKKNESKEAATAQIDTDNIDEKD